MMSNEKFTQGEWRAEITRVYLSCGRMMWVEGRDFDAQIANAHLISAAPDMYRMLEQLHEALSAVPVLQVEIETVLKKARGEK